MKVLICYDISDNKIRRRLVKFLEKFGIRVQYSVFAADLSDRDIKTINQFADKLLQDQEGCRFFICKNSGSVGSRNLSALPESFMIV